MRSNDIDLIEVGDLIVYGELITIADWRMFARVVLIDDENGIVITDICLSSERSYVVPLAEYTKIQDYHLVFTNFGRVDSNNLRGDFPEYFI